ncbi:cyclin-A2-4 [Malania oleifera]|uniref:cyclin-A2-4 n=1 Tax=Malania oleifera TaxID=397392 RepID=UPI0025ADDD24|nr:cyclin-A2-4 [Malania oleifera]
MKKETLVIANVEEPTARITRARAAAFHAWGGKPTSKASTQQDQKPALQPNRKRAALNENNSNAADTACLQLKRRAVLKNVTNVCCENSLRNCIDAAKIQSRKGKQCKRRKVKVSKVVPSVVLEIPQLQTDVETKMHQIRKKELKKEDVTSAESLEEPSLDNSCNMRELAAADCQLERQNLAMPPLLQSPLRKAEKVGPCGKLKISSNPDVKDIDSDHHDPQLCSPYAAEIYSNLCVAELKQRPSSNFMETVQRDITQCMRGILVDWLVEVSEEYKLVPDTLYLTVHLIDLFLSQNYIERQRLQLLGITCMLIASKYEEICAPHVEDFCFITDSTYTREEVLKMESRVLNNFGFQISAPTTKTFLRRFVRAAQATYKNPSFELEYLANYLAELTLLEYDFLNYIPSLIAASAVFLARWTLDQSGHPWNPTLAFYTTYKASDLKTMTFALQDLQMNTNGCPLNSIRAKYRQEKFKSVAALSSPKLLQTLF